jgi:hypothetical protein|tara:strand:+ start:3079 stop:3549 length:471 start_codon:yes stop_codon:yes gene_type:complete
MSIKAKVILKDKFWIVEEEGEKLGTLSFNDERFMFSANNGVAFFENKKQLKNELGLTVFDKDETTKIETEKEIYGFPTSTTPYNVIYDVHRKFALFTKSIKSKSLYCAGFYIIHFDKGWVKSFCPKLITLERYDYKGPFKNDLTMRQELSNANQKT